MILLNKYIEEVFNDFVPDNKGYMYIGEEKIFVPIYRVTLTITKRRQTRLNLVEEMVLKIANCGVNDIGEISGILGLTKEILDITIGDLFVKNLAYPSSNKCYLMQEGREVLRNLEASKKETDIIRNIYVNAVTKEIIKDKINLLDRCADDDHKMSHTFEGINIDFYRSKIGELREIFDKENEIYSIDSNQIPDELISVDAVEDINVSFLKIPLLIYVSENGTDLDLISSDKRSSNLLDGIKSEILDQIRKHKLLKKVFTKYSVKERAVPLENFAYTNELKTLINKYVVDKNNQSSYYDLIQNRVFSNRVLIERELEKLFELCLRSSQNVTFFIDNLDYWSKNSKFIHFLTLIPDKIGFTIYYNNVSNKNLAEKRLKRSIPNLSKDNIKEYSHDDWFRITFENKLQIIGCAKNYKALNSDTWIIKSTYYLQIDSKSHLSII